MNMTDKPSRDDVLKVACECGFWINKYGCISTSEDGDLCGEEIYRFAAAMYAAGAEAMRERAAEVAEVMTQYTQFQTIEHYKIAAATGGFIRALPITTNTEGEQA